MWSVHVPALLEAMGLVSSRSEARRLQAQGGVRMDGQAQQSEDLPIEGEPPGAISGSVWQVGRRRVRPARGDRRTDRPAREQAFERGAAG